jgi:hypothetical protein
MTRWIAVTLVILLGGSGSFAPAPKPGACPMPGQRADGCVYCAPAVPDASGRDAAKLEAGCCRFRAGDESNAPQAASLGAHPKPLHSPDLVAALPGITAAGGSALRAVSIRAASGPPPSHAPPTRTTHLLL